MNIFTNYIYIIQRDLHCNGDVESIGNYIVMVVLKQFANLQVFSITSHQTICIILKHHTEKGNLIYCLVFQRFYKPTCLCGYSEKTFLSTHCTDGII